MVPLVSRNLCGPWNLQINSVDNFMWLPYLGILSRILSSSQEVRARWNTLQFSVDPEQKLPSFLHYFRFLTQKRLISTKTKIDLHILIPSYSVFTAAEKFVDFSNIQIIWFVTLFLNSTHSTKHLVLLYHLSLHHSLFTISVLRSKNLSEVILHRFSRLTYISILTYVPTHNSKYKTQCSVIVAHSTKLIKYLFLSISFTSLLWSPI